MSPYFRTTTLKRLLYMKKIIKVKKVYVKTWIFKVNIPLLHILKVQHKGHKIGPHKVNL